MNNVLIVISGTTQGLGKALKELFIEKNHILSINRKKIDDSDLEFDLSNKNIDLHPLEVRLALCEKVIFISNASTINPIALIDSISDVDIDTSIYTNYINPSKIIIRILESNKQYVILNITSGAAFTSNTKLALYSASKASMHRFIDILKKEEENNPNALFIDNFDPGRMQTEMQNNLIHSKQLNTDNFDVLNKPAEVAQGIYQLVGKYI